MSWLDRLKGKGGTTGETPGAADDEASRVRPFPPRSQRPAEGRAEQAVSDDLDALLSDIASGLSAGRPTSA
ncbi:hypothetical protein K9U40_18135, partial [Xanthobacter autotrophicus]|uniref:hypothetical protein n=1 Tax=Xanthobacter autotrophicus TaxID=280 RepID=UPI0024AB5A89